MPLLVLCTILNLTLPQFPMSPLTSIRRIGDSPKVPPLTLSSLVLPQVKLLLALFRAKVGCSIIGHLTCRVVLPVLLREQATLEGTIGLLTDRYSLPNNLWLLVCLTDLSSAFSSLMLYLPSIFPPLSRTVRPRLARLLTLGITVLGCLQCRTPVIHLSARGLTHIPLVTAGLATTAVGPEPYRTILQFLLCSVKYVRALVQLNLVVRLTITGLELTTRTPPKLASPVTTTFFEHAKCP